ncbi:hypothetical protein [Flavobacterium eburneipallidum]|uniref:hypothetical protein n=1 Tax=Flavobacterium eburneipallidum TaxID=3003263 RepID=UPI0022ABDEF7|nr:hypothetical protein [Flavobacterium eburneipallidum]
MYVEESVFIENNVPNIRKYRNFNFNNSEIIEHNKLNQLQVSLRKLKLENDTINGIKIHFGNKANYAVFVKVLDIITIESMPVYCPYKNDIWVFVPAPKKPVAVQNNTQPVQMYECVSGRMSKEDELRFEAEKEKREFELKIDVIKKHWMLYLGYFGIVLLNIFTLIKFNRSKTIH